MFKNTKLDGKHEISILLNGSPQYVEFHKGISGTKHPELKCFDLFELENKD